ncbi:hypothetical protein AQJ91_18975 [Streptomyces dysideae]|uniref:Uncharacterized protein n=1 Tax=Streptomyces dysideae TaxID=909626 RepID=A0A101UZB1_9ACTN|nr:hypothetical protein AQJ91_18975 [Streptomyces dysideae]
MAQKMTDTECRAFVCEGAQSDPCGYMGEERAQEFGARNGVLGELLVRVTIDRILADRNVVD